MEEKRVLTPQEVAAELGLGLNVVYRELRAGTIPSVRCGDRYLISRIALNKWLEGESKKTAAAC